MNNAGISYLKEPMEQMAEESAQMMLELLNRGKKKRASNPPSASLLTRSPC